MKHKDLFCASPASTAICSSMDKRAIVHQRTRPISRSHLSSADPKKTLSTAPCISQLPFDPKTFTDYQKSRKNSSKISELQRKSSANIDDMASPPHSSRFIMNENPIFELVSNSKSAKALVRSQKTKPHPSNSENYDKTLCITSSQISSTSSLSTSSPFRHQVVELRVSIHCKGCEGKVRKHISRMEGVTWFSIDMELKKVTVIGDVTPEGVLASISKVKNAQIWPSSTSSSPSSTPKLELITI